MSHTLDISAPSSSIDELIYRINQLPHRNITINFIHQQPQKEQPDTEKKDKNKESSPFMTLALCVIFLIYLGSCKS